MWESALPIVETDLQLDQLPEETARRLFEALRLKITYNKITNQAACHITLTAQTIAAARHAAHSAITAQRQADTHKHPAHDKDQADAANDDRPGPILSVPPAGPPKDGTWPDQLFSSGCLVVEAVLALP